LKELLSGNKVAKYEGKHPWRNTKLSLSPLMNMRLPQDICSGSALELEIKVLFIKSPTYIKRESA
jgi:hypothetical protein